MTPRPAGPEQEHRGVSHLGCFDRPPQRRPIAIDLQNAGEAGDPRSRERLDRSRGDGVHADVLRPEIGREVADGRLERGLRHAHHVVVLEDTLASEVGQREDAAAPARLHQRQRSTSQRNQRIGADVQREREAGARGLHEREPGRELFARRVCGAVHQEVEPAELLADAGEDGGDLAVVGDVTRQDQRVVEPGAELADVLLEPLTLIGHRQPGAGPRGRFRNRPRDRPLVGHADDEPVLPSQISHSTPFAPGRARVRVD